MDKYIYRKRKALADYYCRSIIRCLNEPDTHIWGDPREWEGSESGFTYNPRGYYACDHRICEKPDVKNSVERGLVEYLKRHKFLGVSNPNPYYRWVIEDKFIVKKFLPGQYYNLGEHMENGRDEENSKRILAWMIYLNDVKHRGGTCWPQQRFTSKPRQGDLYIWPSGWTYTHYDIPAPKEEKYLISGWCSL